MGEARQLNNADKRVRRNNELVWHSMADLSKSYLDEYPFSARAVARHTNGRVSKTIILEERGGLKSFTEHARADFTTAVNELLKTESISSPLSLAFCRQIAFLIADNHWLFELDLNTDSHRNAKIMLEPLRPFMRQNDYHFFFVETYLMFADWQAEHFARELAIKYDKRLQAIFHKYQIARPTITFSGGET